MVNENDIGSIYLKISITVFSLLFGCQAMFFSSVMLLLLKLYVYNRRNQLDDFNVSLLSILVIYKAYYRLEINNI